MVQPNNGISEGEGKGTKGKELLKGIWETPLRTRKGEVLNMKTFKASSKPLGVRESKLQPHKKNTPVFPRRRRTTAGRILLVPWQE